MTINKEKYISELRSALNGYASISSKSWSLIESIIRFQTLEKGELLLREGQIAQEIHFVCKGALRAYYTEQQGNTYNKNIFLEGSFAASRVSMVQNAPSHFTIEALEPSVLINLNYRKYRKLMQTNEDIKDFEISYLEKKWVMEKEQREISLIMETATQRYLKLLHKHPGIDKRIPQYHIASHLGITPTQLSRIRKGLKESSPQHM